MLYQTFLNSIRLNMNLQVPPYACNISFEFQITACHQALSCFQTLQPAVRFFLECTRKWIALERSSVVHLCWSPCALPLPSLLPHMHPGPRCHPPPSSP